MKKLIKKIAVVLTCIITVMSFQTMVFAGSGCDSCGSTNTHIITVTDQYNAVPRPCPACTWYSDIFSTYRNYSDFECYDCGYTVRIQRLSDTYDAYCTLNDINYEVHQGWNMGNGYDLHNSLDYWKYGTIN